MVTSSDDLRRQEQPVLTSRDLAILRRFGAVRPTERGDVLFEVGDADFALVVVLSGRTEIVDRSEGGERSVATSGPGQFEGELGLLTGQTMFAACVVREAGEVLMVPREAVRDIIATVPPLGDVLVTAMAARRQLLMRTAAATLTLIGPKDSHGLERLETFAARNRIPYRCLVPEDPAVAELVAGLGVIAGGEVLAIVRGQRVLRDPSTLDLAKALGLDLAFRQDAPADLVVVGAGPAGLSAAVYGASEGLSTVVVDELGIGGQAGMSSRIENYLGFPTGISGGDLAFRAEVQALKFGARVTMPRRATSLAPAAGLVAVGLDDGTVLVARGVVLATGARYRDLGLPDQATFAGVGVYYAATELEARLCRGGDVVIVGAGNAAGQAAMFLSETAHAVHLVCRGPDLGRSMSRYLASRLEHAPNVRIRTGSVVTALQGEERLRSVTISNAQGGTEQLPVCALFAMIGADPRTGWLRGAVDLDEKGFVLTGSDVMRDGTPAIVSPFQTSQPGVFAVGDVRSGSVKRVASAVGEGAVVVQAVHRHLAAARGGAASDVASGHRNEVLATGDTSIPTR
ncbi:MAG: Thioredoxin reductase [uncultured Thermomicrobiales bacterium]|uniref:Thioredoxin reductase n=1 Tax=uncultured Thermomicrobiales bacterium TaxID=1645740 RepID=A0A6J4UZN3_9BACT|nr:MAG: Thioredoxin reductase [uncultured Thermomicrobiales bacterium]